MASSTTSGATSYSNLDWDKYLQYRPTYPPSLVSLIYKYHAQDDHGVNGAAVNASCDRWNTLLDIGGDPSPLNHEQARVYLGNYVAVNQLQTKLSFTKATAEEARDSIAPGTISLAICATTAHFIDSDELIKTMAHVLRPGGTMAIYSYGSPVFPDQDWSLSETSSQAAISAMKLSITDETRERFVESMSRACAGKSALDAVGAPAELFEDVRRIVINPLAEKIRADYLKNPPVPCIPKPVQIGDHEQKIVYDESKDLEAQGWTRLVDLAHLRGMIKTILPANVALNEEQQEAVFGSLDRVFAAECPSGAIRALWGLNMILATRK